MENLKVISENPLFLVNKVADSETFRYNYCVSICKEGELMKKISKNWLVGIVCTVLVGTLLYHNDVFALKDKTLDEMITDYFTIIEDDGTTRIVSEETVSSEEGEEVSVAEKYDVVSHVGGDLETVETYESKAEAQDALDSLNQQRSATTYTVEPYSAARNCGTSRSSAGRTATTAAARSHRPRSARTSSATLSTLTSAEPAAAARCTRLTSSPAQSSGSSQRSAIRGPRR